MEKHRVAEYGYPEQCGAVLFVSLVVLLLVSLLTSAAVRSITQGEKIINAAQNAIDTFYDAELALAHCETLLESGMVVLEDVQGAGQLPLDWYAHPSVWESIGKVVTESGRAVKPFCAIELIDSSGLQPDLESLYEREGIDVQALYRVTSRSTGNNNRSESILESLVLH